MNFCNWFEIPVNDIENAKSFYQKVFEVELTDMDMGESKMAMFPYKQGEEGTSGALIQGAPYKPSGNGSVVYLSVDSIEDTLGRVEASGGKMLVPKISIGEHGWVAQFEDCEGNRVALHSRN